MNTRQPTANNFSFLLTKLFQYLNIPDRVPGDGASGRLHNLSLSIPTLGCGQEGSQASQVRNNAQAAHPEQYCGPGDTVIS